jgi:hypothetical protein
MLVSSPRAAEVFRYIFRCSAAVVLISRIGRDRLDAQKIEQASDTLIEVAVDTIEHRVKRGHQRAPYSFPAK